MEKLRVRFVAPVYPQVAIEDQVEGSVQVHVLVKDGTVVNADAVSGPQILRQPAIDAVKQWTYKPLMLNGQPAEVETTVTVNFNLKRR